MKKVIIGLVSLFLMLLLCFIVFAEQLNSTTYKQNVIASAGGDNVSSSSYRIGIATGIIAKILNSTSYLNKLGFFHTWLLADGQPCTSANQCEGGFCCSNICRSSACPSEEAGPSGGGGAGAGAGGGGGGIPPNITETKIIEKFKDFSISPNSIKEQLTLGGETTRKIKIRNNGDIALRINLNVLTVNDFVSLSDTGFSLDVGEEKIVEINLIGRKLGSYFGEIEVTSDGIKKSISIVVEVKSDLVLFDVKLDIPVAYKEVEQGNELRAQITLLNVGPARKVDVTPTYMIKDKFGRIIDEESETFAVEKQTSYVKIFKLQKVIPPGEYLAIVEVRYANSFAVSSELFRVVEKKGYIETITKSKTALVSTLVISISLMFFLILLLSRMVLPNFGKRFRKK